LGIEPSAEEIFMGDLVIEAHSVVIVQRRSHCYSDPSMNEEALLPDAKSVGLDSPRTNEPRSVL
jgi:hypothetical protein